MNKELSKRAQRGNRLRGLYTMYLRCTWLSTTYDHTREKVKKGFVMRSLRAALTGDVHGPDLIESWLLLAQRGLSRSRWQQALTGEG